MGAIKLRCHLALLACGVFAGFAAMAGSQNLSAEHTHANQSATQPSSESSDLEWVRQEYYRLPEETKHYFGIENDPFPNGIIDDAPSTIESEFEHDYQEKLRLQEGTPETAFSEPEEIVGEKYEKALSTFVPIDVGGVTTIIPIYDSNPSAGSGVVDNAYRMFHNRPATAQEIAIFSEYSALEAATKIYSLRADADQGPVVATRPSLIHVHDGLYMDPAGKDALYDLASLPKGIFSKAILMGDANTPSSQIYYGFVFQLKSTGDWYWNIETTGKTKQKQLEFIAYLNILCTTPGVYCTPTQSYNLGKRVYFIHSKVHGDLFIGETNKIIGKKFSGSTVGSITTLDRMDMKDPANLSVGTRITSHRVTGGGLDFEISATFSCFAAGTPVWTERGLVPIEKVVVGDHVLSTNESTGETAYKPVLNTFVNSASEYVDVTTDQDVIRATTEHPFRVADTVNGVWVPASVLLEGTKLMTIDSSGKRHDRSAVRSAVHGAGKLKTYNFEVADWHTYHVGKSGVLVHNASTLPPADPLPAGAVTLSFPAYPSKSLNKSTSAEHAKSLQGDEKYAAGVIAVFEFAAGPGRAAVQGAVMAIRGAMAGARVANPTLVIGKIGADAANPAYVAYARSVGAAFYPPVAAEVYSAAHNIGFLVGYAMRYGAGSIIAQPGVPYTGMLITEVTTAYTMRTIEAGISLSVPFVIGNVSAFTGNDQTYWDSTIGRGTLAIIPQGGGPTQNLLTCGPGQYGFPDFYNGSW